MGQEAIDTVYNIQVKDIEKSKSLKSEGKTWNCDILAHTFTVKRSFNKDIASVDKEKTFKSDISFRMFV